jgi:uncharacterized protein (TIGR04551 family)
MSLARTPAAGRALALAAALSLALLAAAAPATAQDAPAGGAPAFRNPYGTVVVDPDAHLEAEDAYAPLRFELDGYFRLRGTAWGEPDLGRLTTLPEPTRDADWVEWADLRVRLAPRLFLGREATVHLELDLLDNLVLGSTPDGLPRSSTAPAVGGSSTQEPPAAGFNGFRDSIVVTKAYLELMTPIGLLLAGRMGNNWGLGLVAAAGDELDDDYTDSVDRVGFATSLWDHAIVLAYDFNANGPTSARAGSRRGQPYDLTDQDDVRTLNVGIARFDTPEMTRRLLRADRPVFNYGVAFSYRWQDMDLPAYYVLDPTTTHDWAASEFVERGFEAYLVDAWLRFSFRLGGWTLRLEAEGAYSHGAVEHPDPLPNVAANFRLTSDQAGVVARLVVQPPEVPLWLELHGGWASGDPASGFGVWTETASDGTYRQPAPGDLDGMQIQLPHDTAIDNFRFHPNYRIDQILWRRLIGTFTDAWFLRGDVRWYPWPFLKLHAGAIYSETLNALSAPGLASPLGVEVELSATYYTRAGFEARLLYAGLLPLSGLRDYFAGRDAEPSHVVRTVIGYRF